MQTPQIIVYEPESRLLSQVRSLAEGRKWLLREAKTPEATLKYLQRPGPAVVLIRVGRDLYRELNLLERVAYLHPDAAGVVVGDSDHAVLAGLAWDFGARAVLIPTPDREVLQETVAGLLRSEEPPRASVTASE